MSSNGYTGGILKVNLSDGTTTVLPTEQYAEEFIGGRGLAARLYWDTVPPNAGALDPENCLILVTGPLAGFTRLGGSRWQICGKSPGMEPQYFSHANLGGSWGAWKSFSSTVSWSLPSGESLKTIQARLRDHAGRESTVFSDSIYLDTTAPTVVLQIENGAKYGTAPM